MSTPKIQNLDGKQLLLRWLELGSAYKVQKELTREGHLNPSTRRPFTVGGISHAVWKYCINNPEESYDVVVKYRVARGEYLTLQEWVVETLKHSSYLSTKDYIKFLRGESFSKNVLEVGK
jgi:hypothetical protein